MSNVTDYYENYREEDRLSTNNARRIEFLTTWEQFRKLFKGRMHILDCAAGTGAYAFPLAELGHEVTATDITPRHIAYIRDHLKGKPYDMRTTVLDASDLSVFGNESFDAVLNMGPFYHLTEEKTREKCFAESLRVLKKGGYLVTAYIPRFYINQMLVMAAAQDPDEELLRQIRSIGVLRADDPKCFWTDSYYSTPEEMESLYARSGLRVITHFAQDGMAPMFSDTVDSWDEERLEAWVRYHLSVCEERSILGMSNHTLIIGQKDDRERAQPADALLRL